MVDKIYVSKSSDDGIVGIVNQRKRDIATQRAPYEKQWLTALAFLYGKHYFSVERRAVSDIEDRIIWELKNLEREKKTRRIVNYIRPLYRSQLSRMLKLKSHVTVEPGTNTKRDIDNARVSREVLEDFWLTVNRKNPQLRNNTPSMLLVLKKLFSYMLAVGNGYLKPVFNPAATSKTVLNGQIVSGQIGEIEVEVLHPFEVYMDRMQRFCIQSSIMDVEQIRKRYGVKVAAESVSLSEGEKQLLNLLEGSDPEKYENAALINQMYEIPSEQYPDGRIVIATSNRTLIEGKLPDDYGGALPFFGFTFFDMLMSPFGEGMIDQLIDLQQDYNYTVSRISAYKKWFAGKVKVPKNCNLQTKFNDEIGQLLIYDAAYGEPHFESPPSPPAFLFEEIVRIRRDMEDLSAVHDSSLGRVPGQVKSGVAIAELSEADDTQLGPVLLDIEMKLANFGEMVLHMMSKRYTEPRLLSIAGDNMGPEIRTFIGTDLADGNRRITVTLGSGLPLSRGARQEFIMSLYDRKIISREKVIEVMEFGNLEEVFHPIDESAAKMENSEMLKGAAYYEPQQWEEHTIHLKTHLDVMKGHDFKSVSGVTREMFTAHVDGHRQFLLEEQRAQQAVAQGAAGMQ